MNSTVFFVVVALVIVAFLFNLVRSRRLREKYVALWMLTAIAIIALAFFPHLLGKLAQLVGIQVPSNLLFALAIFLLLGLSIQLSLEISRCEDKTRVLAENVAILNLQIRELQSGNPQSISPLPQDQAASEERSEHHEIDGTQTQES
jgi:hypothetical protein